MNLIVALIVFWVEITMNTENTITEHSEKWILYGDCSTECQYGIFVIGWLIGQEVKLQLNLRPDLDLIVYQNVELSPIEKLYCREHHIQTIEIGYRKGLKFGKEIPYPLIPSFKYKTSGTLTIQENSFEFTTRKKVITSGDIFTYFHRAKKLIIKAGIFDDFWRQNGYYYNKKLDFPPMELNLGGKEYWMEFFKGIASVRSN